MSMYARYDELRALAANSANGARILATAIDKLEAKAPLLCAGLWTLAKKESSCMVDKPNGLLAKAMQTNDRKYGSDAWGFWQFKPSTLVTEVTEHSGLAAIYGKDIPLPWELGAEDQVHVGVWIYARLWSKWLVDGEAIALERLFVHHAAYGLDDDWARLRKSGLQMEQAAEALILENAKYDWLPGVARAVPGHVRQAIKNVTLRPWARISQSTKSVSRLGIDVKVDSSAAMLNAPICGDSIGVGVARAAGRRTTAQQGARWPAIVATLPPFPQPCLLSVGANHYQDSSSAMMALGASIAGEMAIRPTSTLIIPSAGPGASEAYARGVAVFRNVVLSALAAAPVRTIIMRNALTEAGDWAPDGIHPSAAGYAKLWRCFVEVK